MLILRLFPQSALILKNYSHATMRSSLVVLTPSPREEATPVAQLPVTGAALCDLEVPLDLVACPCLLYTHESFVNVHALPCVSLHPSTCSSMLLLLLKNKFFFL